MMVMPFGGGFRLCSCGLAGGSRPAASYMGASRGPAAVSASNNIIKHKTSITLIIIIIIGRSGINPIPPTVKDRD